MSDGRQQLGRRRVRDVDHVQPVVRGGHVGHVPCHPNPVREAPRQAHAPELDRLRGAGEVDHGEAARAVRHEGVDPGVDQRACVPGRIERQVLHQLGRVGGVDDVDPGPPVRHVDAIARDGHALGVARRTDRAGELQVGGVGDVERCEAGGALGT